MITSLCEQHSKPHFPSSWTFSPDAEHTPSSRTSRSGSRTSPSALSVVLLNRNITVLRMRGSARVASRQDIDKALMHFWVSGKDRLHSSRRRTGSTHSLHNRCGQAARRGGALALAGVHRGDLGMKVLVFDFSSLWLFDLGEQVHKILRHGQKGERAGPHCTMYAIVHIRCNGKRD